VDVDGEVSACVTLATSYQRFQSPLLRQAAERMRLGNVRSRTFPEKRTCDKEHGVGEDADRKKRGCGKKHADFSLSSHCPEIFLAKEDKRSSYRNCRDCRYFMMCLVCPVSIAHAGRRPGPRRIPDFGCAFNFAAARQWETFRRNVFSVDSVQVGS
jgi:hypothetical protein